MACCHCEASQTGWAVSHIGMSWNVAKWQKKCGPSLVPMQSDAIRCNPMHVLRFWMVLVYQLPTTANPWCSNPFAPGIETCRSPPTPAFSATVKAVVKVGTSTRLPRLAALLPASFQICTVLLLMKEAFHWWSVVYQWLSHHWSSFPPGFYGISSTLRWKQQPSHLWEMMIQFRGPSWEGFFL